MKLRREIVLSQKGRGDRGVPGKAVPRNQVTVTSHRAPNGIRKGATGRRKGRKGGSVSRTMMQRQPAVLDRLVNAVLAGATQEKDEEKEGRRGKGPYLHFIKPPTIVYAGVAPGPSTSPPTVGQLIPVS